MKIFFAAVSVLALSIGFAPCVKAEQASPPIVTEEEIQRIIQENQQLRQKLAALEATPSLSCDLLAKRTVTRLKEVAADTKIQRQAMADFESYVKWMGGTITGYRKYIEAGSMAAGFAKVLPIPYAGQAGMFTKFVGHFALSLNSSSAAINRYLTTSQQFLTKVEALPADCPRTEVNALIKFADEQLLRDMTDVQQKLSTTADLSASTLSFLESLNHYVGSSDEYWQKTKNFLKKADADKAEKGYLAENIENLKNKVQHFNGRLKAFEETARKEIPLIKSLAAYDELMRDMDAKVAAVR